MFVLGQRNIDDLGILGKGETFSGGGYVFLKKIFN